MTRLCVLKFDVADTVVVGWHRVDSPEFPGQDDGQDFQRLAAALKEASLPKRVPYTVSFMDVEV